jgi:transcriptional regulator of heat shock response
MKERQRKILKAVVKEYQRMGEPVASQILIERYHFDFSPATIRAEMLELDEAGYLEQPHTSAGRVPTDKALRFFIEELNDEELCQNEKEQIWQKMEQLQRDSLGEMAQFLADCSRSLGISGSFGRLIDFHEAGFKWLAEEPEFVGNNLKNILKCFDSLESDFSKFFGQLDEEVEIFIGQENPIRQLRHCSLMIIGFGKEDDKGLLGILGPKRMNYQKNRFVLEETRKRVKTSK